MPARPPGVPPDPARGPALCYPGRAESHERTYQGVRVGRPDSSWRARRGPTASCAADEEATLRDRSATAIWLLAVLALALAVRLPRILATDFPINDGGIFFVMAGELSDAHLALPAETTYNNAHIPFAYPPLGLYLAAALHLATGCPILTLERILPLLANLLTAVAFFFLARRLFPSASTAGLAALLFVTLPRSYEWLIAGGGLTRSFGFLFLCLAVFFGHRTLVGRHRGSVVPAGMCLAFAILSHPEMGLLAAAWLLVLTAVAGLNRWTMARAVETAAVGALLVAPWLATVLARHGLSPFLGAAGNSGFWLRGSLARLLSPQATGEIGFPIVACLALLGTVVSVARREFLLPGWLLAAFVLTPRAALTPATAPLALLAALALAGVVAPGLASALAHPRAAAHAEHRGSPGRPAVGEGLRNLAYGAVIMVLVGYTLVVSNLARTDEGWGTMHSVPRPEREAMAWVAAHTPATSRFVVASSATWWPADPVDEWFPALTSRASVVAPNGAEWLQRGEFKRLEDAYTSLKRCSAVDGPCLDALSTKFGVGFTHVYVSKPAVEGASGRPRASPGDSPGFVVVYDGPGATVYARRQREFLGSP